MRIYECADYRAMSRQAANVISAGLRLVRLRTAGSGGL